MKEAEQWTVHTRRLPPLAVAHHMRIQYQTGPHPNNWDKTDVIIELCQFDQYVVCQWTRQNHPLQPHVPEEICPRPNTAFLTHHP